MRWGLLNQILNNPSRLERPPMSSHYLALAKRENVEIPHPQLTVHTDLSNSIKDKLQGLRSHQQLYILCPGAEYGPAKQWPIEHFAELAKLLVNKQPNCLVLILGSKKEAALGEQARPTDSRLSTLGRVARTVDSHPSGRRRHHPSCGRRRRRQ